MIVLKSISQISDKFADLFGKEFAIKLNIEEFVLKQLPYEYFVQHFHNAPNTSKKRKEHEEMCEMLFQLKDVKPSISNYIKVLLVSQNYESIFHFMRRFIVAQFGDTKFSLAATGLSQQGRLFERFLEIALHADLKPKQFFLFVFACLQSEPSSVLFAWKEPAKLFLRAVNESENAVLFEFAKWDENIKGLLEYELGLTFAVEQHIQTEFSSVTQQTNEQNHVQQEEKQNQTIITTESFDESEMQVSAQAEANMHEGKLDDTENVVEETQSQKQTTELAVSDSEDYLDKIVIQSSEIAFLRSLGVENILQFKLKSKQEILPEQTFVFGQPIGVLKANFANQEVANDEAIALLFRLVKLDASHENLNMFRSFKHIFEEQSLKNIAVYLFEKLQNRASILEAKWAVRYVSIFANESLSNQAIDFAKELREKKQYKEAKYLLTNLFFARQPRAMQYIEQLISEQNDWAVSEFSKHLPQI